MIPFEGLLAGDDLQQVTILSYTASLSHFEYAILPNLRTTNDGAIGLLVDRGEYDQCFSETTAVSGPGVFYRLHPVDLPNPNARFHPKLYILVGERTASVVVSSANLTIYGCRSNFEVVDLLRIGGSETPDLRAFGDCMEFLQELGRVLLAGPEGMLQPLAGAERALGRLVGGTTGPDSGARLLHTLKEPLIDQVVERVPPDEVEEITVVSPFYDPRGRALRRLAARYDRAQIRVILASPRDANMDGAALIELGDRLGIERADFQGGARWLHAKLYAFKGPERAWLLSGSANLSSAAWLKSTESGGNVEVVTLREVDASAVDGLMTDVSTQPLDFGELFHQPDEQDEDSAGAAAPLRLLHATETDGRVEILVAGCRRDGGTPSFKVTVQGRGPPHHPTQTRIRHRDDGVVRIQAGFGSELESEGDGPLTVTVDDGVDRARIWVDRPRLLALSRADRAVRRTLAKLESGSFGDRGDFDAILGLISRYASEISLPVAPERPSGDSADDGTGKEKEGTEVQDPSVAPTPVDHLTVRIDDISVDPTGWPTSTRGMIQRAIRGFDRFLAVMSTAEDEAESGFPSAGEPDGSTGVEATNASRTTSWTRDAVNEFDSEIEKVLDRVASAEVNVAFAANMLELADILSRLAIHLHVYVLESDREPSITEEVPRLLSRALRTFVQTFSIRGSSQGTPGGWLVRAWLEDQALVRETVLESGRLGSILSFIAAGAVLSGNATAESSGLACVMAGIRLIAGAEEPVKLLEDGMSDTSGPAGVQRLLGDRAREGEIREALTRLAELECPTLRTARWWGPFLALRQAAKQDDRGQLALLEDRVRERSPKLLEYYERVRPRGDDMIVRVEPDGDAASCGGCHERLAPAKLQELNSAEKPFAACDSCGALLIPIDVGSEAMRLILTEIDPALRKWLAP
ncbi:hypothetical protein [Candidatus Palauibacter sp.]|uniref:hypothetical protein n=1 Tax=Candidatus Palauibacter sp. TaxID=3101350 RepID=UPI003B029506